MERKKREEDERRKREIDERKRKEEEERIRELLRNAIPCPALSKYKTKQVLRQDKGNDDVNSESEEEEEEEEKDDDNMPVEARSNQESFDTDSSGVEEPQKPMEYYLNNFGVADNPIVFSGELYRFKPGISNNFISRWVEVSTHAFRYFKNYYSA